MDLDSKPLDLADDQALPRSLHDRLGHFFQRIDFENSFHLGKEAVQQSEVAARNSDNRRHCFRVQRLLWKTDAGWCPTPVQQFANLLDSQRPKLMDEADAGVELREACQFFLKPWHSNQDDSNL